jgi:hypothetical protein
MMRQRVAAPWGFRNRALVASRSAGPIRSVEELPNLQGYFQKVRRLIYEKKQVISAVFIDDDGGGDGGRAGQRQEN